MNISVSMMLNYKYAVAFCVSFLLLSLSWGEASANGPVGNDGLGVPEIARSRMVERNLSPDLIRRLRTTDADSLFRKGFLHTASDPMQTDSAMIYYSAVISRGKYARGDSSAMAPVVKSLINTSFIYTNVFNDLAESYMLLRQAEELCEEYGMRSILAHVYLNLSEAFSSNENLYGQSFSSDPEKESWDYLKKAFDMAESTGNGEVMVFAIYNMSNSWLDEQDDMLGIYADRFMASGVPKDHESYPYMRSLCLGLTAYRQSRFGDAMSHFEDMAGGSAVVPVLERKMIDYAKYLQGLVFEKMGRPREALSKYMEIHTDSARVSDLKSVLWSCSVLSSFFHRQGDHVNFDKYQLEYYRTKETMESSGLGKNVHELEMRRMIDGFRQDLDEAEERDKRNRFLMISGSVVCVVIILSLFFFIWYSRKRRRYITTLYEKNQQLSKGVDPKPADMATSGSQNQEQPEPSLSEKEEELQQAVARIMEDGSTIYNPEFQLSGLCAAVGSNPTYVSKAVSRHYGKSFKAVLTELRVKEACRRFDNPTESGLYTIEAICREVGFKSRAAFSVAFKNVTGLTPTEYRNAARKYSPPGYEG